MAECLLNIAMKNVNTDHLTAVPDDVVVKKTFLGSGGSDRQEGIIPVYGKPTIDLPLSGAYKLPMGKYDGGKIQQQIHSMGAVEVNVGKVPVTIPTKDTYMNADIKVKELSELTPSVIKKGEYVGGIGPGTWEGYEVTDPDTFYYRGTYGPGQTMQDYPYWTPESRKLYRTDYKDHIEFYRDPKASWHEYSGSSFLLFAQPLDITTKNKLSFEVVNHGLKYFNTAKVELKYTIYLCRFYTTYLPSITKEYLMSDVEILTKNTNDLMTTFEFDLSKYDRSVYLTVVIFCNKTVSTNLYGIKFI